MSVCLSPFLPSRFFPDVKEADENGLLCVGDVFSVECLIDAYSHGIFPWPFPDDSQPPNFLTGWFSVEPRCILEWENFHVPRRLKRTYQSGKFDIRSDTNFHTVMSLCAENPNRKEGSWITPPMLAAYTELHRLGMAHSVETYHKGALVGGVYGVALRGLFAAESMFYLEPDASKVALVALAEHLQRQGFQLLDTQVMTDNTARFGATEIARGDYLRRLHRALQSEADFGRIGGKPD